MAFRSSFAAIAIAAIVLASPLRELRFEVQSSGVATRLRGISAVSEQVAWASGAHGTILRTIDGGRTWQPKAIPGTGLLDFRDIDAISDRIAYTLSIGPGKSSRIYKTADGGTRWDLQFANDDPALFLDAMAFWDAERGVAVADSIGGAFVVLTTADGGRAWRRVVANRLPPALPDEGAFAASGTNVTVRGHEHVWIGTGAGRVLRSIDGARTWSVAGDTAPCRRIVRHFLNRFSGHEQRHRGGRGLPPGSGGGPQHRADDRRRDHVAGASPWPQRLPLRCGVHPRDQRRGGGSGTERRGLVVR